MSPTAHIAGAARSPRRGQSEPSLASMSAAGLRAFFRIAQDWDLSVDELMQGTGLSRTAFYRFFPDREAVLLELLEEVWGALAEARDRESVDEGFKSASLVELRESDLCLFCAQTCSTHKTAAVQADAGGNFLFDYVRQTDCSDVYQLKATDPASQESGTATGAVCAASVMSASLLKR